MRWIEEHKFIVAGIAIFVVLVILLAFSFTKAGEATVIGRSVQGIFSSVDGGAGKAVPRTDSTPMTKKALKKRVSELEAENRELQKQLDEEQMSASQLEELRHLSKAFDYDASSARNTVAADVTSFDKSVWTTIFTINVGTSGGVSVNDVVINADGLVGRVISTGKNSSKVIAVIDDNSTISFEVSRDSAIEGLLNGCGKGNLEGFVLKSSAGIVKGDKLVTTGKGMFPAGLDVGTVTKIKYNDDTQLKEVTVKPSVDFRSLKKVAVIE